MPQKSGVKIRRVHVYQPANGSYKYLNMSWRETDVDRGKFPPDPERSVRFRMLRDRSAAEGILEFVLGVGVGLKLLDFIVKTLAESLGGAKTIVTAITNAMDQTASEQG